MMMKRYSKSQLTSSTPGTSVMKCAIDLAEGESRESECSPQKTPPPPQHPPNAITHTPFSLEIPFILFIFYFHIILLILLFLLSFINVTLIRVGYSQLIPT